MKRLEGKVAIITGGSRGIGFAITKRLAEEGAKVLIADVLEEESKQAVATLKSEGHVAEYHVTNVRNLDEIYGMTEKCVELFGALDILVNNAGIQKPCPSMYLEESVYDAIMEVNLKGAFFCCQAAGRYMREHGGGKIVNISSGNSRMINVGRLPYNVSKSGINALTASLGAEWAMYGIRVNAVAPGWIHTDMVKNGIRLGALKQDQIFAISPVERWGTEEEIANLVLYLASDESSYIVGQTIFCDGGWSAGILPNALDYIRDYDKKMKESK